MWILYIIIFVFFSIVPLAYYMINYNKNKSKIRFDLKNNLDIDIDEKYEKIKNAHNKLYKTNFKYILGVPCIIGCFITIILIVFNIIGLEYLLLFFILLIFVIISILTNNVNTKNTTKKLHVEYERIVFDDFFANFFEIEKSEKNYNLKTQEYVKKIISKLFKDTKRKLYNKTICYAKYECKNRRIVIYDIGNYKTIRISDDNVFRHVSVYSFIGYLVEISNFNDMKKLEIINKKDYYYDEENKLLYLLISNSVIGKVFDNNKTRSSFYKKFEADKYLKKSYLFYKQFYKYIQKIIE